MSVIDHRVSRRALFGRGLSRALDELPVRVPDPGPRPPSRPAWNDLLADAPGDHVRDVDGRRLLEVGARAGAGLADHADDSFDAVVSTFGVIYAEHRRRTIAELFRVVRPGGVVSLACWTRSGFMGAFLKLVAEQAWPEGAPDPTVWGRQERLRQDLEPYAGEAIEFEPRVVPLEFESPPAAWREFAALPGPIAAGIDRLDDDRHERLEAAFLDLLPARKGTEPFPTSVTVDVRLQLVTARRAGGSAPGRST